MEARDKSSRMVDWNEGKSFIYTEKGTKGELHSISYLLVKIIILLRGRNEHIRPESENMEKYR